MPLAWNRQVKEPAILLAINSALLFATDRSTVGNGGGERGEEHRFQLKIDLMSDPAVAQRILENLNLRLFKSDTSKALL